MTSRLISRSSLLALLALALLPVPNVRAVDYTGGSVSALPVKDGVAPVIDGDLSDWDLSAQEPVYISSQTAEKMNAEWAVMYDKGALYLSARVTMPDRAYHNPANIQDGFWWADCLQVRLTSDPALGNPLDRARDEKSDRIASLSFWKNSETGESFLNVTFGTKLNLGKTFNPEGSKTVIKENGKSGYVMESRIPWSALNVPGGINPFKPGESGAFFAETLWIGGDPARVAMCYTKNVGTFGFSRPDAWGRLVFAAESPGKRVRPTMEEMVAEAKAGISTGTTTVGVPIEVTVPDDNLKVSVNIFDENGGVIRELIGGEPHPKGSLTVRWDGRDAFGNPMKPGNYRWGAYFHHGLKAEFQGSVGVSGNPSYNTMDGKGAWGGDHTNPIDAAADADSLYLLWPVSEAGKALVKTDLKGNVLWRKNPFVGGGFGPFYAVATEGKNIFLIRGDKKGSYLVRVDSATGALLTWPEGGASEILVCSGQSPVVPTESTPSVVAYGAGGKDAAAPEGSSRGPDSAGLAVRGGKVYVSSYSLGKIFIVDAETGSPLGELACPGVRGISFDAAGNLLAVSYLPEKSQVVRFSGGAGEAQPAITSGLEMPYDVAATPDGHVFVSDLGKSQQVKEFDAQGRLVKALGEKGGRPWQGRFAPEKKAFLVPAGLAVDANGDLIVAESSPPKAISRVRIADGAILNRWYGPGVYWNSTWPMPEDPGNVFYTLNDAIGRGHVAGVDKTGVPDAYWQPDRAGFPQVKIETGIPQPEAVSAGNKRLYLVRDTIEHAVMVFEKDETLRPVATWTPRRDKNAKRNFLDIWIDLNGDGKVQKNEETVMEKLADGSPLPEVADRTASMHMEPNGDLYFATQDNRILKIPAAGFGTNGLVKWNVASAKLAVPEVMPGMARMNTTYREGLLGTRLDKAGNIYTVFNTKLPGKGGPNDFATPEVAARKLEGTGHTARFNIVKFAKFSPAGKLLWMAGRKATAGAKPGEMYHFWNIAGLVNNDYVAGASEWGVISFYTQDGFFIDAIMSNPGDVAMPGPYTFSGETSGGQVAYFPKTGQVWAYTSGMAYTVEGFKNGKVEGESRASGTVKLDQVYAQEDGATAAAPMSVVVIKGNPMADPQALAGVPVSVVRKNDKPLASVQIGYDPQFLYARMEVVDPSPLENGATPDEQTTVFKHGDTAGLVLGPVRASGDPGDGDIRFMAVKIQGQPKLIAMKPVTKGDKKPFEYSTPAGGRRTFEFVGEVPGAQIDMKASADGYVATFAVPRSFLEFPLEPGTALRGDIEIRTSGGGQRGLQTVGRNYLFTPQTSETSMVDDTPTEARMYPAYWGKVDIR